MSLLRPQRPTRRMGEAVAWLLVALAVGAERPLSATGAFELLDRTVAAYRALDAYHDRGELVVIETDHRGTTTRRYDLTTAAQGSDSFVLRIDSSAGNEAQRAIWLQGGEVWQDINGIPRRSQSAAAALALVLGADAVPAFLVPMLLLDASGLSPAPDAAAVDGTERCGAELCDVLVLSWQEGSSLSRLWIDRTTHLVRRLEIDLLPLPGSGGGPARVQRTLTVRLDIESIDEPLATQLFTIARVQSPTPPEPTEREEADLVISEEISVELRTLPVRALDRRGRPIPGLRAADFEVRLGGAEIPVVAADWIPTGGEVPDSVLELSPLPPAPMTPREEIHGNTIVFFIQADMNAVRVKGHLRILPFVRELLDALEPQDWVAVISFDSHLKLWHDFSRDRRSVGDAIERAVRFGNMPIPPIPGARALASSFPVAEAKRAARPEKALYLTARSLLDVDGEKIIVYLGWGLGRFGGSGFSMTPEYDRALAALKAARASVFVLDVTDADYHTLELGIRRVAADTGGTYAKTNDFARREVLRLTEAISGYYLLTLDRDSLPEERRKLRIRLKDRPGEVLVRDRELYR